MLNLTSSHQLHTLIMLNMGSILDLPSPEWFGEFDPKLTVHVIDSTRPQNLSSLFGAGENGDRIVIWDDGEAEKLSEERKAWEALTVRVKFVQLRIINITRQTVRAGAGFG
jgi:cell division control protein 45